MTKNIFRLFTTLLAVMLLCSSAYAAKVTSRQDVQSILGVLSTVKGNRYLHPFGPFGDRRWLSWYTVSRIKARGVRLNFVRQHHHFGITKLEDGQRLLTSPLWKQIESSLFKPDAPYSISVDYDENGRVVLFRVNDRYYSLSARTILEHRSPDILRVVAVLLPGHIDKELPEAARTAAWNSLSKCQWYLFHVLVGLAEFENKRAIEVCP